MGLLHGQTSLDRKDDTGCETLAVHLPALAFHIMACCSHGAIMLLRGGLRLPSSQQLSLPRFSRRPCRMTCTRPSRGQTCMQRVERVAVPCPTPCSGNLCGMFLHSTQHG